MNQCLFILTTDQMTIGPVITGWWVLGTQTVAVSKWTYCLVHVSAKGLAEVDYTLEVVMIIKFTSS